MPRRPSQGNISSPYGWRTHPISGQRNFHTGEDIGYTAGLSLVAPIASTVVSYGVVGGYGNMLVLRGGNVEIWLAHTASRSVPIGANVAEGQQVAIMGKTGNVTGVHVHWEVRVGGVRVDPAAWLAGSHGVSSNAGVADGQRLLNQFGYGLTVDGINGPKTKAAVRDYQSKNGLVVDGILGPKTAEKMRAQIAARTPAPAVPASAPTQQQAMSSAFVAAVQRKLKTNYPAYAGRLVVDGIWGPKTKAAVVEFQRRSGLVPDGIVGPKTRAKLGI